MFNKLGKYGYLTLMDSEVCAWIAARPAISLDGLEHAKK
jgi:hypothetical protein